MGYILHTKNKITGSGLKSLYHLKHSHKKGGMVQVDKKKYTIMPVKVIPFVGEGVQHKKNITKLVKMTL